MRVKQLQNIANDEYYYLLIYRTLVITAVIIFSIHRQLYKELQGSELVLLSLFFAWNLLMLAFGHRAFNISRQHVWVPSIDSVLAFCLAAITEPIYSVFLLGAFMSIVWIGILLGWKAGLAQAFASCAAYALIISITGSWGRLLAEDILWATAIAYSAGFLLVVFLTAMPLSLLRQLRAQDKCIKQTHDAYARANEDLVITQSILKRLHKVNAALQTARTIEDLEKMALKILTNRFGFSWSAIVFLEKNDSSVYSISQESYGRAQLTVDLSGLAGRGIESLPLAFESLMSGRIIHVSKSAEGSHEDPIRKMMAGQEFAIVPMISAKRKLGIIIVTTNGNPLSDDNLSHVHILASQVAVASASLELHKEKDILVNNLLSMYGAVDQVTATSQLDVILTNTLELMRELTDASKAIITLVNDKTDELDFDPKYTVIRGKRAEYPELWWKSRLTENIEKISATYEHIVIEDRGANSGQEASIVCVPLHYRRHFYGVMASVFSSRSRIEESDLLILSTLARLTAVAVENSRLLDRTEHLVLMNERTRIAQDMHDGLAQSLFSLVLNIEVCSRLMETDPDLVKERLQELQGMTSATLKEVRQYIYDLRPGSLDELGLKMALEDFVLDFRNINGIEAKFRIEGKEYLLPPAIERSLYYIGKEAIINAMKYSMANEIDVGITYADTGLLLTVADNGIGFDVSEALQESEKKGSLGLTNMKERAARHGGECRIISHHGSGVKIEVSIPRTADIVRQDA